jgi:hypothetical protein
MTLACPVLPNPANRLGCFGCISALFALKFRKRNRHGQVMLKGSGTASTTLTQVATLTIVQNTIPLSIANFNTSHVLARVWSFNHIETTKHFMQKTKGTTGLKITVAISTGVYDTVKKCATDFIKKNTNRVR